MIAFWKKRKLLKEWKERADHLEELADKCRNESRTCHADCLQSMADQIRVCAWQLEN